MKMAAFLSVYRHKCILAALLLAFLLVLSACQSTQFLWQAARGQWQIVVSGRPLQEVISDPATSPETVSQLQFVQLLRNYAEQQLYLPVNNSYNEFVDLKRRFVVWNLFVTPELALTNETWCYPIAGCVAYQGYFDEPAALEAAQQWQQKNFDTHIGGVTAYSTLGWFDDPVLNTFLFYNPVSLAGLLFHELAHAQLYVPNDTTFNESWATAVEQEAVEQFVNDFSEPSALASPASGLADTADKHPGEGNTSLSPALISQYKAGYADRQFFVALVQETIAKLAKVYDSDATEAQKRKLKADLLTQLRQSYLQAVDEKKISNRYLNWFAAPLNNAKLSTVSNYQQWVPALRFKIRSLERNWLSFYQWSAEIAELEHTERNALLEELQLAANQEKLAALAPDKSTYQ